MRKAPALLLPYLYSGSYIQPFFPTPTASVGHTPSATSIQNISVTLIAQLSQWHHIPGTHPISIQCVCYRLLWSEATLPRPISAIIHGIDTVQCDFYACDIFCGLRKGVDGEKSNRMCVRCRICYSGICLVDTYTGNTLSVLDVRTENVNKL